MLLLKICTTPLLILLCLLASRRLGAFTGGILAGLPLISGPISLFLALEQGQTFAAQAAYSTLLGVMACAATAISYPWFATLGLPWYLCLPLSLVAFALCAQASLLLPHLTSCTVLMALLAPAFVLLLLPHRTNDGVREVHLTKTKVLIAIQMACGALLVLAVSEAASLLDTHFCGVLSFFPTMIVCLAPFIQITAGPAHVTTYMRGLMAGWYGGIAFILVVMLALEHLSIPICYSLATLAALVVSTVTAFIERHLSRKRL